MLTTASHFHLVPAVRKRDGPQALRSLSAALCSQSQGTSVPLSCVAAAHPAALQSGAVGSVRLYPHAGSRLGGKDSPSSHENFSIRRNFSNIPRFVDTTCRRNKSSCLYVGGYKGLGFLLFEVLSGRAGTLHKGAGGTSGQRRELPQPSQAPCGCSVA